MGEPRNHIVKTWAPYFQQVADNVKTFEVRRDDRDYRVGDVLTLREYDPAAGAFSGRSCQRHVTLVLPGGQFGIAEGYVVMAIAP